MKSTKNYDKIFNMAFSGVYPHYVNKDEKKGRAIEELHQVIFWITGYDEKDLNRILTDKINFF